MTAIGASAAWEAEVGETPPETGELLCPAAEYRDHLQAGTIVAYGDVLGTTAAPRVEYYPEAIPITPEIAAAWAQGPINPGEIVRTAGRCKEMACQPGHWDAANQRCRLIDRWVAALEPVTASLPRCSIRTPNITNGGRQCRAWVQQKAEACRRCPGFVSETVWKKAAPLEPVTASTHKIYL
jgi:hypothetical protein